MMYYAFNGDEWLLKAPTINAAHAWLAEISGKTPERTRVQPGWVRFDDSIDLLREPLLVDHPNLLVWIPPRFPTSRAPLLALTDSEISAVTSITRGEQINLKWGEHVPVILGLAAMGRRPHWIARALETSVYYTRRVLDSPRMHLSDRRVAS